jgi:hypothetical protein
MLGDSADTYQHGCEPAHKRLSMLSGVPVPLQDVIYPIFRSYRFLRRLSTNHTTVPTIVLFLRLQLPSVFILSSIQANPVYSG